MWRVVTNILVFVVYGEFLGGHSQINLFIPLIDHILYMSIKKFFLTPSRNPWQTLIEVLYDISLFSLSSERSYYYKFKNFSCIDIFLCMTVNVLPYINTYVFYWGLRIYVLVVVTNGDLFFCPQRSYSNVSLLKELIP